MFGACRRRHHLRSIMICEKCPASFMCLAWTPPPCYCQRCQALVFAPPDHAWGAQHSRFTVVTVRCTNVRFQSVHGIEKRQLKLAAETMGGGCIRCNPLHYELVAARYDHVFHYHHGRDGSILEFTHLRWGKRQAWWFYADADEPAPGFFMEKPREAP
jgi:hypothetical protein